MAAAALAEDGDRDLTSECTVSPTAVAVARLEVRAPLVLAGIRWANAVAAAAQLPPPAWEARDGDLLEPGRVAARLHGPLRALLRAERSLLNLLQRASGIATTTRRHVEALGPSRAVLLHTRKTAPGLRLLDAMAVVAGGGGVHRLDLATEVMIKDNHWHALHASGRTLAEALAEARRLGVRHLHVEVESEAMLREAVSAGATRILVDNQPPAVVAAWTVLARTLAPAIEVEATGGITLASLAAYGATGVDCISLGALTHSAPAADISLEMEQPARP